MSGDPRGRDRYRWPRTGEDLDADALADIARFGRPALSFVRDRADLGALMPADADVHRGPVRAKLPAGSAAAVRLVRAVILARFANDTALESAALEKLARDGDKDVGWGGEYYAFRDAVAFEAKRVAAQAGDVDVSDLLVKPRGRSKR